MTRRTRTARAPYVEDVLDRVRSAFRVVLGAVLIYAGVGHLWFARDEFQAQVPEWMALDADLVVLLSGAVEILLGLALLALPRQRVRVGIVAGAFFVAVFPGNIAQWTGHRSAFGLDTDQARFIRLFFQPLLVAWALCSTGAWKALRGELRTRVLHADTR